MGNWIKRKKFKVTKGLFTVEYDTASELGEACAEIWHRHGELIVNPYDPDFLEFEEFEEARRRRMYALNGKEFPG